MKTVTRHLHSGLVTVLLLSSCWRHGRREDRPVVAIVGGVPIYADDFKRQLGRMRLEPDDAGPVPHESDLAEKRALLDDMVDERLLIAEAEKHNVTVPLDAVESSFQKVRAGWKEDEFASLLKEKDLTPAEIKSDLREMLLVRKFLREFVFARVAVTDAEIETYVKEHADSLTVPEQVHARQIVVKTDEEAKVILSHLQRREIGFEDAAIKNSLTPDARTGGDLGWFARGVMPKIFDDTCFAMRPGEVSGVVPSPYGYHLFKVLERHPASQQSLADVRERIEMKLRHVKERAAQLEKLRELRSAAQVQIKENNLAEVL